MVSRDLDGDGVDEQLVVVGSNDRLQALVFAGDPGEGWRKVGVLSGANAGQLGSRDDVRRLIESIRAGRLDLVVPRYLEVEIDGQRLRFDPF